MKFQPLHRHACFCGIITFLFLNTMPAWAQTPVQTLRGKVTDADTHFPLPGASVLLYHDSTQVGSALCGENGVYQFDPQPVGRYLLKVSFIGYEEKYIPNVVLSSARETEVEVELIQNASTIKTVTVSGNQPGQPINEMSTLSVKQFSIDETNRYAGSRSDPARMASNFAGVQGADDSRNDIVIRGNSPGGVLWRMEGIDIFNPNHFNIPGTAGGSVSILNNKILGNSDFFTGAFPAEYGNSISGVFDLQLKHGSYRKREYSAQLGLLGTELYAEGPFNTSKKISDRNPSFLFSYRYSTLALFSFLHVNLGTSAVPNYQDAAFNLNFPLKHNADLSFFGMGGLSHIYIKISNQTAANKIDIYAQNDRDQYFASAMGITGLNYVKAYNANTYLHGTIAFQADQVQAHHECLYRHVNASDSTWVMDQAPVPLLRYDFRESKISASWFVSHKFSSKVLMKAGFVNDYYFLSYIDSIHAIPYTGYDSTVSYPWTVRWNSRAQTDLFQPYIQFKFRPTNKLTINAGLHAQLLTLQQAVSPAEPRLGIKYDITGRSSLALAAGMHSEMQPLYIYFYGQPNPDRSVSLYNEKLGFTRSLHYGLSYQQLLGRTLRLLVEVYDQQIYQAPVEKRSSSFSLLNSGSGFSRFFPDTLVNTGTGQNYGLELTLEKSFSHHYFFLFTGSYFQSTYTGSDGKSRPTDFDGGFDLNLLGSREFVVRKKNILEVGGKITTAGGRWYGPVDTLQSNLQKDVILVDSTRNSEQFSPYFRFDLKLNYKINRSHVSHEIGIDLVNVLNTKNILKLTYAPSLNPADPSVREEYQLGRLPLFYYKIDF